MEFSKEILESIKALNNSSIVADENLELLVKEFGRSIGKASDKSGCQFNRNLLFIYKHFKCNFMK